MPELPDAKRAVPIVRPVRSSCQALGPAYAELHAKSNFSFLEGASHPDELVSQAALLGYTAIAVTDRSSLAGVVRAHVAAKEADLPLLIGAEITPADAAPAVLWATDRAAYGRLCQLLTLGRRRAPKGECDLAWNDLAAWHEGLLVGVLTPAEHDPPADHARELSRYRELFGDRCHALAEPWRGPDDEGYLDRIAATAKRARVPMVAAGDVHYHVPERQDLHDCLVAIGQGLPVAEAGESLFPNSQRYLKTRELIARIFHRYPDAIARTVDVASRCRFSLDELRYEYPEEMLTDEALSPMEFLKRLTWEGAARRYPEGISDKVHRLLTHELELIEDLHYEAYFLTVWDLVRYARSRGILCQGRGSAANSAVCYCLEVTSVDPARIDLLFERFVSRERDEAPDIDIDFEHERREEVLQYIYEKYGRERAGMAAEVITYRPRSAVRDLGKTLGLSLDRIDTLSKAFDGRGQENELATCFHRAGLDPESPLGQRLQRLVAEILSFPRHLSQHVGGMVMTRGLLCELVPIENAAMPDRTVIQWDKDDLDALGILKVDCLGLGMLTAIRKAFELIARHEGRQLTLATVPPEDPAVYSMIQEADTIGVFQVESRAQMAMLPRLKPNCYYDLVVEVAIVRPGPIQGNMVHPYLRRRMGDEEVDYPSDAVRDVLQKTLGVPIFQEQAMRLAVVAAGFTPGEADQLRRAMGAWRKTGVIDRFHRKLVEGMKANGFTLEYAERVFNQIRGFGEYGFPESHAASFALLVYVSAWIKRHYPAVFTAALLNSQPLGFYAPAQLIRDARDHGVEVRPIDVNRSDWDMTLESKGHKEQSRPNQEPRALRLGLEPRALRLGLEPWALRLGLRLSKGLSKARIEQMVRTRTEQGLFRSLKDLGRRGGLSKRELTRLARTDALGSLKLDRRAGLWEALAQGEEPPLFAGLEADSGPAALPSLSEYEEVAADYRAAGLSLRQHPFGFIRERLNDLGVVRAVDLKTYPNKKPVRVAGLVLMRQQPGTAKGIRFVTLEDETGVANLVVYLKTWERQHHSARRAPAMLAHGILEREQGVIHVITHTIKDVSSLLADVRVKSRDYR
ncbi:Error-prone DNA polymerase [Planctomycetes bacterium Pan216]|uniref:Error-prone DNA polymerase n=1 Tax=Kolteria novifilia TaxID=2527975 RepID=A0A518B4E6_9BACT|nr:Error-prone DNA polymerase [Planctomycetes bacterium Pan216]